MSAKDDEELERLFTEFFNPKNKALDDEINALKRSILTNEVEGSDNPSTKAA
jgi:hypothetical protein